MCLSSRVHVFFIIAIQRFNVLLSLFFGRVMFAAVALSLLTALIIFVRKKNLAPGIRSFLWAFCVPALFIPFERGVVILMQGPILDLFEIFPPTLFWQFLLLHMPSYIWLTGFIVFIVQTHNERKETVRLLKAGEIKGCAVYFYKFRSHIYTPPNFDKAYTENEREMLLAHERQHIKQRDPLLFLFLQGVKCVFWFNPLIHKAVRHIRHDRELLCDERVTARHSKFDYGKLLLSEAKKALPIYPVTGIASQPDGMYERIAACTRPFSKNKGAAVIIAVVAVFLFSVGAVGFTRQVFYSPMEITIFCYNDSNLTHEGFEKFVTQYQGNIIIDEQLYLHALSEGFSADDELLLFVLQLRRPSIFNSFTGGRGFPFTISDLQSGEIVIPYYDAGYSLRGLWGALYRIL